MFNRHGARSMTIESVSSTRIVKIDPTSNMTRSPARIALKFPLRLTVGDLLGSAFEFQEFEIGGAGRHHHLDVAAALATREDQILQVLARRPRSHWHRYASQLGPLSEEVRKTYTQSRACRL
jgi:hypothetical protein